MQAEGLEGPHPGCFSDGGRAALSTGRGGAEVEALEGCEARSASIEAPIFEAALIIAFAIDDWAAGLSLFTREAYEGVSTDGWESVIGSGETYCKLLSWDGIQS